jgi:hypothetical protein
MTKRWYRMLHISACYDLVLFVRLTALYFELRKRRLYIGWKLLIEILAIM